MSEPIEMRLKEIIAILLEMSEKLDFMQETLSENTDAIEDLVGQLPRAKKILRV